MLGSLIIVCEHGRCWNPDFVCLCIGPIEYCVSQRWLPDDDVDTLANFSRFSDAVIVPLCPCDHSNHFLMHFVSAFLGVYPRSLLSFSLSHSLHVCLAQICLNARYCARHKHRAFACSTWFQLRLKIQRQRCGFSPVYWLIFFWNLFFCDF